MLQCLYNQVRFITSGTLTIPSAFISARESLVREKSGQVRQCASSTSLQLPTVPLSNLTFCSLTTSHTRCERQEQRLNDDARTVPCRFQNSPPSTSGRVGVVASWKRSCRRPLVSDDISPDDLPRTRCA